MPNYECEYCGSQYEKFHDEGCPGCGARRMRQINHRVHLGDPLGTGIPYQYHDNYQYGSMCATAYVTTCCTSVGVYHA